MAGGEVIELMKDLPDPFAALPGDPTPITSLAGVKDAPSWTRAVTSAARWAGPSARGVYIVCWVIASMFVGIASGAKSVADALDKL